MQLKDVMTPGVEVIAPEASIYEAAEKMSHLDIGPLPVCDGERLIGMLTDRDITVRAVAAGRDPLTTKVREVMTPDVVYGFDDQDIQDAARLMAQYQIRRLPVLNRSKQLVGMVALGDLAVHPGDPAGDGGGAGTGFGARDIGTEIAARARAVTRWEGASRPVGSGRGTLESAPQEGR
jgi:CBS domain-containing protein